jgi:hypothetical protein
MPLVKANGQLYSNDNIILQVEKSSKDYPFYKMQILLTLWIRILWFLVSMAVQE